MPRKSDAPQKILRYIADYTGQYGISPTVREISAGTGVSSLSTVHRHVRRMKDQGLLIDTKPGCSRSLAISSTVSMEAAPYTIRHLCLQTDQGGTLILDCKSVNGHLEFNGPVIATDKEHRNTAKIIACKVLDDDAYEDFWVL